MNKNKIKWQSILNYKKQKTTRLTQEELEELYKNIPVNSSNTSNSFSSIQFPIVKRVMSTTLANGGWVKSKKQQLREDRINKIRKVQGQKPNVTLPNDEYVDGLVSVQPLSMPLGNIFYMDYKYQPNIKQIRKKKLERLNKLVRINKLKDIGEILKL